MQHRCGAIATVGAVVISGPSQRGFWRDVRLLGCWVDPDRLAVKSAWQCMLAMGTARKTARKNRTKKRAPFLRGLFLCHQCFARSRPMLKPPLILSASVFPSHVLQRNLCCLLTLPRLR